MNMKTIKNILVTISLLVLLIVASTLAYFTSIDAVSNRFTAGNLDLEIIEEAYDNYSDKTRTLGYNQVMPKDPKIYNNGNVKEIVFMEVKIPLKKGLTFVESDADGEKITTYENDAKELFDIISESVQKQDAGYSVSYDSGNWIMLTNTNADNPEETVYPKISDNSVIYLFGYKTVLGSHETTETALFDKVQLKPLFEYTNNDDIVKSYQNIKVRACGIQAENINVSKTSFEKGDMEQIYGTYFKEGGLQ